MSLFNSLGFIHHPFMKTNADDEENLSSYFVPPSFYDAVRGDYNQPHSCFVFAPRGAGKSALKKMIETSMGSGSFLSVSYDRFEFSASDTIESITLQYHLRNVITRILLSYFSYIGDDAITLNNLTKDDKNNLGVLAATYLGNMKGKELHDLLHELKGLPQKFKDFWRTNVGILEPVLNYVLKAYELPEIDLPKSDSGERKLDETYKFQLDVLNKLVCKMGFKSIYVLIDKVDETELTGNDPEKSYKLISSMVRDLDFLGLKGYAFKFFLWDKVKSYFNKDARPDRFPVYDLSWKRTKLQEMLKKRLSAFSDGNVNSLNTISELRPKLNYDEVASVLAWGSPRNMIRLCEKIFAYQSEISEKDQIIAFKSFDMGSIAFAKQWCNEVYQDAMTREIVKIGKDVFTNNYVASSVFKVEANSARNKINQWINKGAVKEIGTVTVPTSKKPLKLYVIEDYFMLRVINENKSISSWFSDCHLPCSSCDYDNMYDFTHYPEDNTPICVGCGRSLI